MSISMANPRNRNFQILFFFSYLQVLLLLKTSTAFTPADNHLLNCGSATKATVDNRVFLSDSDAGSFRLSASSSISLQRQHPSPDSSPLYQAARIFTKPSSYEFNITTRGTHFVRLHFSPFSSPKFNLSSAVFSVSAHGLLLLKDFSVSENTDLVKEFLINISEEKFDISFTPSCKSSSFAFVNAIEVFSVPKDLILDVARFVDLGKVETFDGLSKQAFETVYRLNIGGDLVTSFNDTLWRTWLFNDEEYLKLQASAKAVSFSGRINYQPGGASREVAPDSVYRTARVMNSANVTKPNFNITWIFPVNLGYQYLVRMHFCDIVSLAVNDLYFDIYINGYSASKDFDLSNVDITNQFLASPYYMDFVVAPKSSGEIHVTIGPSRLSSPSKVNALLNGLEIMKMNNSMGSFDGQFSVDLVLESWPKGHWGIWVLWIVGGFAIMSMLVTGFIMESRRRMELKGSVAWSPLPVDVDDNTRFGSSPLSGKLVYY